MPLDNTKHLALVLTDFKQQKSTNKSFMLLTIIFKTNFI